MGKQHLVYFITDGKNVKIGVSNEIKKRLKQLQTSNAEKLTIAYTLPMDSRLQAYYIEKSLHAVYKKIRKQGEWFHNLSLIKAIQKAEKLQDKHREAIEKPRTVLIERLRETVGGVVLDTFIREAKAQGATQFALDTSDYGFVNIPMCLYAMTSTNRTGRDRKLVGHLNKNKSVLYETRDTIWSDKGRTLLQLGF